ncbi:MAG: hypothetical protein ACKO3F_07550 [Cyanobium sp.]
MSFGEPAQALDEDFGKMLKVSLEVYKICRAAGDGIIECSAIAALADPPTQQYTQISMQFKYDTSKWIFRPNQSGFLCQFSINGSCPPANPFIGEVDMDSVPDINFQPGLQLPGSTYRLIDDTVNGIVELDYQLAQPLETDIPQNFYSFYFDAVSPVALSSITYFDTPGDHDFSQLSASCFTTAGPSGCSDNSVEGFELNKVPGPLPILGAAAAFGYSRKLTSVSSPPSLM